LVSLYENREIFSPQRPARFEKGTMAKIGWRQTDSHRRSPSPRRKTPFSSYSLIPEHFGHNEYKYRAAYSASKKQVKKGIAYGSKRQGDE
jgi:hypothetical protein